MNQLIAATKPMMESSDLFMIINDARDVAGEGKVRLNDFHARVVDELEGDYYENFVVQNPNKTESVYYRLTLDQCMLVAMRESKAVRKSVLAKVRELESQQAPKLPQSFAEALQLAANQAKQIEDQQQAIELAAPKVEFVNRYVESKGSKGFRQVAKLINANENEFRAFLIEQKIMYKLGGEWTPYENHVDAGRFETKTGTANEHAYNQSRFTPKGVQWVAGIWIAHKELK